mgnify:CR=1 FL=1
MAVAQRRAALAARRGGATAAEKGSVAWYIGGDSHGGSAAEGRVGGALEWEDQVFQASISNEDTQAC